MHTPELVESIDTDARPEVSAEHLCPYFRTPFPDCYCFNLTSLQIPFVLKYCNGNHSSCDIYIRHHRTYIGS